MVEDISKILGETLPPKVDSLEKNADKFYANIKKKLQHSNLYEHLKDCFFNASLEQLPATQVVHEFSKTQRNGVSFPEVVELMHRERRISEGYKAEILQAYHNSSGDNVLPFKKK
jgi:hypothetical protein